MTDRTGPLNGIWRCSACGEMQDGSVLIPAWRWAGDHWQHTCEGPGQGGHHRAMYLGPVDCATVGETGGRTQVCVDACRGVSGLTPGKVAEIVRAARRVVDIWHDPQIQRDDGMAELDGALEGVAIDEAESKEDES